MIAEPRETAPASAGHKPSPRRSAVYRKNWLPIVSLVDPAVVDRAYRRADREGCDPVARRVVASFMPTDEVSSRFSHCPFHASEPENAIVTHWYVLL
jgi:hypothetical protein